MATKKNAFRSLFMGAAVSVAALMAGAYSPDAEARCNIDPRCAQNQQGATPTPNISGSQSYSQGSQVTSSASALHGARQQAVLDMQRVAISGSANSPLNPLVHRLMQIRQISQGFSIFRPITGDRIGTYGGFNDDKIVDAIVGLNGVNRVVSQFSRAAYYQRRDNAQAFNSWLQRAQADIRNANIQTHPNILRYRDNLQASRRIKSGRIIGHPIASTQVGILELRTPRGGSPVVYVTPEGVIYGESAQRNLDTQLASQYRNQAQYVANVAQQYRRRSGAHFFGALANVFGLGGVVDSLGISGSNSGNLRRTDPNPPVYNNRNGQSRSGQQSQQEIDKVLRILERMKSKP